VAQIPLIRHGAVTRFAAALTKNNNVLLSMLDSGGHERCRGSFWHH